MVEIILFRENLVKHEILLNKYRYIGGMGLKTILKTKEIKGTYLGSLRGGLRAAHQASKISKEKPASLVPLERLGSYPFVKRLSSMGCQALDLSQPLSTYEAFKSLYSVARFSSDNRLMLTQDIESRMRKEGLEHVLKALPAGLLNRLASLRLNMQTSKNPDLIGRSEGASSVTVSEVYERLDIIGHIIEVYKSLQMFRNARALHERGQLEGLLRGRGNPSSVGEEGLIPSIPLILKFSDVINRFLSSPEVEAAFYTGIFLHDLGKFLSQAGHQENTYTLVRDNSQLRKILTDTFSPEQIKIIEITVRYHSLYTDVLVCKEVDILKPFQAIFSSFGNTIMRALANDLIFIHSTADTDAYLPGLSRLANDRMQDLAQVHADAHRTILTGKSLNEIEAQAEDLYRSWGNSRFKSWVIGDTDTKEGKDQASLALAQSELSQIYPTAEEREEFYPSLGSLKFVGLIFDLRKELKTPQERVRLLAWLCKHAKQNRENRFEFQIYREKGKWVGPQVDLMNELLADPLYMEKLDQTLRFNKKPDGLIEIIIPT